MSGKVQPENPITFILREISAEEIEVVPDGSLAREDTSDFQAVLEQALQGGHRTIALDFAKVSTVGSSAIGKILHFKRQCDEMNRRLVIRHCNEQMLQLLKMIKFDALIEIES